MLEQGKALADAVKGGKWILALGLLAMLLGGIGRLAMSMKWEFWDTKAGGFTTAGIMGLIVLGAGVYATGGFSFDLLLAAGAAALAAMGAHSPAKAAKEKLAG